MRKYRSQIVTNGPQRHESRRPSGRCLIVSCREAPQREGLCKNHWALAFDKSLKPQPTVTANGGPESHGDLESLKAEFAAHWATCRD